MDRGNAHATRADHSISEHPSTFLARCGESRGAGGRGSVDHIGLRAASLKALPHERRQEYPLANFSGARVGLP